ncbi:MFS transporter [Micromonospora sp. WMMA1363]|uniref:MFS transporter n=1 Tax=Micromonospora sp. WMMA1363 TaxID=3053985 RepID=UPI00259CF372|nr:MFS transporter [Micromonospora sp. WMMA1363]MDM4720677.1 MFS transporter [Micromonospora sp. WMMA1363]
MIYRWHHPPSDPAPERLSRSGPTDDSLRRKLTFGAAAICIFTSQLDFFALSLALPRMAQELDVSTTNLHWVISGYMIAVGAFLVPAGRLGDIFGRKRILIVGLTIFGLASLGGGLSPNANTVIAFRLVQGIGAGTLVPLSIAVITDAFPHERNKQVIGNALGVGALAMALGPLFGGVAVELIGWRVILLTNVSLSAIAIALVTVGVRESRDPTAARSIDLPGLFMLSGGISAVTYAVDRANAWRVTEVVGMAAIGLLLLGGFVLRERHAKNPMIKLTLFRNTCFVVTTTMAMIANVAFSVAIFSITLYLQQVKGYSPAIAGVIFLAATVAGTVAGPLTGRLGARYNIPRTIAAATALGAVGLLLLSIEGGLGPYLPGLALVGLCFGIGYQMATVGTQTIVKTRLVGEASGVTLTIVTGLAGLGVAAIAMLIEVSSTMSDLGGGIATSLRWIAVTSALVSAAIVGIWRT